VDLKRLLQNLHGFQSPGLEDPRKSLISDWLDSLIGPGGLLLIVSYVLGSQIIIIIIIIISNFFPKISHRFLLYMVPVGSQYYIQDFLFMFSV